MGKAVKKVTKNFKKIAKAIFPVHTVADKLVKGAKGLGENLIGGGDVGSVAEPELGGSVVVGPNSESGTDRDDEEAVELGSGRSKGRRGRSSGRRTLMASRGSRSNTAGSSSLKV